ncbi:PUA-like domain-containing protein [Hyaloraphidium curvatum]|nr:PUA-like domain-containing protein [Hyaloraphidium curvatum]
MPPKGAKRKAKAPESDVSSDASDSEPEVMPAKKPRGRKTPAAEGDKPAKFKAKPAVEGDKSAKSKAKPASEPAGEASASSAEGPRYWLMKAEAETRVHNGHDVKFSIDDLESAGTSNWDGVRNAQAKNFMKAMALGDKVLFYHSNTKNGKNTGVAGLAEVSKEAFPDPSATDESHAYYDPKSDPSKPKWYCVEVKFVRKFPRVLNLKEMKALAEKPGSPIAEMALFKPGRLSVQPVTVQEYEYIVELAAKAGEE